MSQNLAVWNRSSGWQQPGGLHCEGLHSGWLRSQGNPDQFAVPFFLCFFLFGTDRLAGYNRGAHSVRGYILGGYGPRATLTSLRSRFSCVFHTLEPIIWVATMWEPTA